MLPPSPPRWTLADFGWAILGGLAGAFVAAFFTFFGFSEGVSLLILLAGQYGGHLATVAWLAHRKGLTLEGLGLVVHPGDGINILVGVGLQFLLLVLAAPFAQLLGIDDSTQALTGLLAESTGTAVRVLLALAVALVAPVVEELMFRGVLLRAMTDRWGPRAALVWTAVVFSFFHLLGITGDVLRSAALVLPQLFIVGLVLARLTQRRGRLGPAIFTHAGFNLVAAIVIFATR